ncbi:unnamed protein product [Rhodiola kirilowii]
MARFHDKKKKGFVKPVVKKNLKNVDHITGDKVPKSFVFARGKLPAVLRQLQMDLRKLMLPYTALKLKEKKRNSLKDFLNVAGPMGVTHFMILSKTTTGPYLRVARTPQGPTLTFKVKDYTLAVDVARSQLRPRCPADLFKNPPLIVLSGFGTGEQHLKLATIMFQNIFPAIDINTNHQVPDLRNLQDVSDFVTKAGYGSESEGDDEAATVTLSNDLNRVNRASTKSAVKLQELGPRMTLQLIKIEEGLCTGGVIFSEYDGVKKSPEHKEDGKTSNDDGTNGEGQKSDTDDEDSDANGEDNEDMNEDE